MKEEAEMIDEELERKRSEQELTAGLASAGLLTAQNPKIRTS